MKIVSNDFKTKVNEFGRQLDVIITYGATTLTRDNIYGINPNFHTDILKTLMKCVEVEADTLIPVGTRFNVQAGVKVGNAYEYIDYGYYTVKSFEKDINEEKYTMLCYDDMMKTMVDYDLSVTYPISVKNLLTAICTHFGFTLNTSTFVNDDNMITTDVFSNIGLTYRDVLSEIAIATCSTIEIENGVMYLKYPTNTGVTIDEDILNDENVAISEKYGPVNRLVITRAAGGDTELREDATSIEEDGLTELKISDRQIFSTEQTRDNLIDEMWNYIEGFEYYLCNLDTQGLMYLEATDRINVSIENETYSTIVFNDETEISDGLNEEIYTEEPEVNEDEYKYTKSQDKMVKNAYIEVNKQDGKINAVVSEVQTYDERITGTNTALNNLSEQVGEQIADLGTDLSSLQTTVQTNWEQTATSAQLTFLQGIVADNKDEIDSTIATWSSYIRFENGDILLGKSGNLYKLKIENDRIQIYYNDVPLSNWIKDTFTAKQVNIGNLDSNGDLTSGFGFIPRDNGSLSFKKIK